MYNIIRRDLANSNTPVDMSATWLVPQFVLLGLTEVFNGIGQLEFYYSELPNSMASLVMVMFTVSMAVASLVASLLTNSVDSVTGQGGDVSCLSSDINAGHVDYYYWLLSFLNLLNFLYYLICCRIHRSFSSSERRLSHSGGPRNFFPMGSSFFDTWIFYTQKIEFSGRSSFGSGRGDLLSLEPLKKDK
ncbi:putative proton-dependent oligopeptide transporter family [Helianthus annuus]|uniref:Proton-dependent oligopeptide transporter family n=1 Tax=Helianthus annuus TaxID=4232 RepID=A0A251RKW7_HELAN|nr:putative proton-dependent oligopeptide transporter family [Helianthus annuus]KAJ0958790.1 putative proton-dependent oligopeptide transporter family [Helianthus annuus]